MHSASHGSKLTSTGNDYVGPAPVKPLVRVSIRKIVTINESAVKRWRGKSMPGNTRPAAGAVASIPGWTPPLSTGCYALAGTPPIVSIAAHVTAGM